MALLAVLLLASCGGGGHAGGGSPTPGVAPVRVTVSPTTASVQQGGTSQFSANVTGTINHAVTWSVQEGTDGGSIDQTGLYTAPLAEVAAHVVATSVADPTKSSSAVVTAMPVSVWMSPALALPRGRQRQFTAYVYGTVVKDVTWSVDEGAAGGTITAEGLYTAPLNGGPFHVTARSVADSSKAVTTAITLTDAGFRLLNASMLSPRIWHSATLLANGKVLIAGGRPCNGIGCSPFDELASAELFDPVTESFSPTGSMSVARAGHTATLLDDGKVLIAGGWTSSLDPPTAELYDPATGTFSPVGDMGSYRAEHIASRLGDGRVLVAGGYVLENNGVDAYWVATNTAQVYDPATQSFSPVGGMPVAAAEQAAAVLLDGKVLLAGGDGTDCAAQTTVAIFDPNSNAFSAGMNMPEGRGLHTVTALNDGRMLMAGGIYDFCLYYDVFTPTWEGAVDTAVVFDPAGPSYSPALLMRERRWGNTSTLLNDGKVLVVGVTADLFDPATSTFVMTGDPYVANVDRMRSATRLADGRVLFTSGSRNEIYE